MVRQLAESGLWGARKLGLVDPAELLPLATGRGAGAVVG